MVGILFAVDPLDTQQGWAFPASAAESALQLTFGKRAPIANAGDDQDVKTGSAVTLDGSNSSDPEEDPLTHSWEQVFESPHEATLAERSVALNGSTSERSTFTAPSSIAPSVARMLTFKLTVKDTAEQTDTDTVNVTVHAPPVAKATATPSTVLAGQTVTLDGSGSTGHELTYKWDQVPGTAGNILSDATAVKPAFTAPRGHAGLTFRLTVKDKWGRTSTDTVNVEVRRPGLESLGVLSGTATRTGSWSSAIQSANRPGSYARFYSFTLTQRMRVQIDLESTVDAYLYLLSGPGTGGKVLA